MKKLSKKEREEVVTKGYLDDFLEEKDYVTRGYLDERLEEHGKEFQRYIGVMTEQFRYEMRFGFEGINAKFEAAEKREKERKYKVDIWLSNHEDRLRKLEKQPA